MTVNLTVAYTRERVSLHCVKRLDLNACFLVKIKSSLSKKLLCLKNLLSYISCSTWLVIFLQKQLIGLGEVA